MIIDLVISVPEPALRRSLDGVFIVLCIFRVKLKADHHAQLRQRTTLAWLLLLLNIWFCSPCSAVEETPPNSQSTPGQTNGMPAMPLKLDDKEIESEYTKNYLKNLNESRSKSTDGTSSTPQSINLAEIRGKVIDVLSNQPLANARAVLSKSGEEHKRYQTESSADGSFSFSNIEPGDYSVTVSAADKLSETKSITLISGKSEDLAFRLEELEGTDILRVSGKGP